MIRTIIIEDEIAIRNDLKEKIALQFDDEIEIIDEAGTVSEGIKSIDTHEPDLLLLDIHLSDGTSFDILEKVSYKDYEVIFATAYDQHAIKAIKVGALDFILKPIDKDELTAAIQKAIARSKKESHLEKLLEVSSEYFKGVENKRIILKTSDNVYAIYEDDILYCRSDGNYTTFYTQQMEKIVISKPIKKVEEILSENVFIRCHQSYIVNKKHVLKYNKKGVLIINLDVKIPVSSRRKDYALRKIFN